MTSKAKLPPAAMGEIFFDIAYLIFALTTGGVLLVQGGGAPLPTLYGTLALVLGFGDSFHLLPRVYSLATGTMAQHRKALAFGKLVTSLTMTVFYLLLYYFWELFYGIVLWPVLTGVVLALAAARLLLCLLPQNRWFDAKPSFAFAIARNVPFVLLGGVVTTLYAITALGGANDTFQWMSVAILLSFGFYLAVVLGAGKHPALGALMLPKTCAYIWILCMGFSLL